MHEIQGVKYLTENFAFHEFTDLHPDFFSIPEMQNAQTLAEQLELVRAMWNFPIVINSGFRTEEHNERVGGAVNSHHCLFKAADFTVLGVTLERVFEKMKLMMSTEIILNGELIAYDYHIHYAFSGKKLVLDKRTK